MQPAPVIIVNLLTTFVIASSPTFWEKDVTGGQPTKEDNEDALDAQFDETCVIYRWDADEVNAEVERAEALSDTLAAETRKQLREARKEARKARREARNDN